MARIAIAGLLHETHCFVPMRTDYAYYAKGGEFPPLARREEVIARTTGGSFGMSGFLDAIDSSHELVPLIWGHAGAGGYVTDDAFERIVGELVGMLSEQMPVDAVYLDLHGAMCSKLSPMLRANCCAGSGLLWVALCRWSSRSTIMSISPNKWLSIATVWPSI